MNRNEVMKYLMLINVLYDKHDPFLNTYMRHLIEKLKRCMRVKHNFMLHQFYSKLVIQSYPYIIISVFLKAEVTFDK